MSWRELVPEPSKLWIRWALKRRPGAELPFVDLVERRIVWPELRHATRRPETGILPPPRVDLAYLPPACAEAREARDSTLRALAAAGVPTLEQIPAGRQAPGIGATITVLDLLPELLARKAGGVLSVDPQGRPAGRLWIVLPLLPGAIPEPAGLADWLAGLVVLGAEAVVPLALDLSASDRRRVSEALGEESFEAVFHASPLEEREAARALAAAGLPLFPRRPESGNVSPRLARNRRLAAALAEAGELTLGLGGAEPEGQSLLAAARHLETTPLDLSGVALEGNLEVVTWLSPGARTLVEECQAETPPATLEHLRRRWLGLGEGN